MMKTSIYLALIVLISCSCKNEKPAEFDLNTLNFKEKIGQVLKPAGLAAKADKPTGWSLAQFAIFESSDPKVMKFNGVDLSGKAGDSVNRVLIHYSIADSTIKLVELKIFSAPQAKALAAALDQKLGKSVYPTDTYTAVLGKNNPTIRRVWIDPKTTIGHFFTAVFNKAQQEEAKLAILDYSDDQVAQLASLKGYSTSVTLAVHETTKQLKKAGKN